MALGRVCIVAERGVSGGHVEKSSNRSRCRRAGRSNIPIDRPVVDDWPALVGSRPVRICAPRLPVSRAWPGCWTVVSVATVRSRDSGRPEPVITELLRARPSLAAHSHLAQIACSISSLAATSYGRAVPLSSAEENSDGSMVARSSSSQPGTSSATATLSMIPR